MKRPMINAVILMAVSVAQGCYVPPFWDMWDEIYQIDQIKMGVTTKKEVLGLLGKPKQTIPYTTEGLEGEAYWYRGSRSWGEFAIGSTIRAYGGLISEESWWVQIVFDATDVVLYVRSSDDDQERLVELIERSAKLGDVGMLFTTTQALPNDHSQKWRGYCLGANMGHGNAQFALSEFYTEASPSPDIIQAYKWSRIAAVSQGIPPVDAERLAKKHEMTADQVTKATRLAAEWKPDPATCESSGRPSGS